ncbi:MAG: hypothetical protein HRT61_11120 [Ekhidna sp.]|nr:hypothetical protein [Ekhidna sp.]
MKNSSRIFPFVWPWKSKSGKASNLPSVLLSKKFSIFYLVVIWLLIAFLGFASTRAHNCNTSWEMAFYCEYAFWTQNLTDAPWVFVRNLFTTLFFHNGLDHILFVSIVGMLMIVQSHEAFFGSTKTGLVFLSAYITVAPIFGVFYTVGLDLFPDSEFMQFAFARNWMGGSIGMFQVFGSLATVSRKPWVMLSIPVIFEIINLTLLGIDLHISLMHLLATFLGFAISKMAFQKQVD